MQVSWHAVCWVHTEVMVVWLSLIIRLKYYSMLLHSHLHDIVFMLAEFLLGMERMLFYFAQTSEQ